MSTTRIRITPEVEAVLKSGGITDGVYRLPAGQLDRKLYESVAKVLKALGGKWDRSRQGFQVSGDFEVALREALGSGVAVDKDREAGFFATPRAVAGMVWAHLKYRPGDWVLEPSCGGGDLLQPLCAETPALNARRVIAVEIDSTRAAVTKSRWPTIIVLNVDFLIKAQAWVQEENFFDCIAMNPPFVKGSECDHLLAAMELLAPDGRLAAIMPSGLKFREDALTVATRDRIAEFGGRIENLPDGSFRLSGTNVSTCLVLIG